MVVLDDLSTGHLETIPDGVPLAQGSVGDRPFVVDTLKRYDVTGVIHLAAKKAVGDSVAQPLYYYRENVDGMLSLLEAMAEVGVSNFVYSSSAAVYGEPESSPVLEDGPTVPMSPYGETKLVGEWLTRDSARVTEDRSWIALRYFNVAGAGAPELGDTSVANLIPIVLRAVANDSTAKVFGDDYPTPDGTCIRDYIHVSDLADAHVAAAAATESGQVGEAINIGTGNGASVLDVIASISRALDQTVPSAVVDRRAGDPAELVAAIDKAQSVLNWTASLDLDDMTSSAVAAQKARAT